MSSIEKLIQRRRKQVLKAAESHLESFPMGETYFCLKAGCTPYTLKNLRKDANVSGETLDKLLAYIKLREKEARAVKAAE